MFELTPLEVEAISLSLKVGFWAVLVSLPLGILAAWILARKKFIGHSLLNALVHLPLVIPPIVIGYLLLVVLGREGAVGRLLFDLFGVTIAFTWKGAAVAAGVMAFPLLVRSVRLSLDAVDRGLEDAAATLGAGKWRVFFTITLPLIAPGILVGVVLAFARSIGEFGATITFVSNIPGETRTLPLALFSLAQNPGGEADAARLVVIAVVIALAALILSEYLARRITRRLEE